MDATTVASGEASRPRSRDRVWPSRFSLLLAPLALLAVLPPLVVDTYYLQLLQLILIFMLLGQSIQILTGFTGYLSLGHAAFFGVGAYTSSLLSMKAGLPPLVGLVPAGVMAALAALGLGAIAFRLRGPYFVITLLALAEVSRLVVLNWQSLTNGALGVIIKSQFDSDLPYYYVSLVVVAASVYLTARIARSKLGLYLVAICEDEDTAEASGIDTTRYKVIALLISAFLAGLAGSLFATSLRYIEPNVVFSIANISIPAVLVAMLGGLGTVWGAVLGAAILVTMSEFLRTTIGQAQQLAYGLLLILVTLFLPAGVLGGLTLRRRRSRVRQQKARA